MPYLRFFLIIFCISLSGCGGSDESVGGSNHPPVFDNAPSVSVIKGSVYAFTPSVTDVDGDRLTYSASNLPAWLVLDATTGAVSGTPGNSDVGSYTGIMVSVSDGVTTTSLNFDLVVEDVTKASLFLTTARMQWLQDKVLANDETWVYLQGRANASLGYSTSPHFYSAAEYTAALALAYRLSGNQDYLDRCKTLFFAVYIDRNGTSNRWDYTNRNGFRGQNRWAQLAFNWIYDEWTAQEKATILAEFKVWGEYWSNFTSTETRTLFRDEDSDEVTSLAENFLLLALNLQYEGHTTRIQDATSVTPLYDAVVVDTGGVTVDTAELMFAKADWLFNGLVVDQYMNDWMRGGQWAEGTDYSPATMQHWMRQFMLNREVRSINYPNTYHEDVIRALVHNTFPAFNGMFMYGDMEGIATIGDYSAPSHEYRFDTMNHLIAMTDSANVKALGQYWLNAVKANEADAPPSASGYTGIWRLLFEDVSATELTPDALALDTTFTAEGMGFVATRTDWSANANVLYFQNTKPYVDHEHKSALSFDIVRGATVITKEMTGYGFSGDAVPLSSTAHNTLLIENESLDGSNDPNGRATDDGVNRVIASTGDYTYIEADATDVYNRGEGYNPDVYADYVVRKLVFLKPDQVVVYDSIGILAEKAPRWTKYIQHFQSEPMLSNGVYSAASEGSRFFMKPLLPIGAVVTKVDETTLWGTLGNVEAPPTQLKWHLSISPVAVAESVEYMNVLYFDADSVTSMPDTQLLHADAANVSTGNVAGAHLAGATNDSVVLFNRDASGAALSGDLNYTVNTSNSSSHYIFGMAANTGFDVSVAQGAGSKTITVSAGSTYTSTSDGVLQFDVTN